MGPITSPALPLKYAHKLASRVFEYFHFLSHKNIDNFPGITRQIFYVGNGILRGRESSDFVQEETLDHDSKAHATREGEEADTSKTAHRKSPWRSELVGTMFYL